MAASEGWIFYINGRLILSRTIRDIKRNAIPIGAKYVGWSHWHYRQNWFAIPREVQERYE